MFSYLSEFPQYAPVNDVNQRRPVPDDPVESTDTTVTNGEQMEDPSQEIPHWEENEARLKKYSRILYLCTSITVVLLSIWCGLVFVSSDERHSFVPGETVSVSAETNAPSAQPTSSPEEHYVLSDVPLSDEACLTCGNPSIDEIVESHKLCGDFDVETLTRNTPVLLPFDDPFRAAMICKAELRKADKRCVPTDVGTIIFGETSSNGRINSKAFPLSCGTDAYEHILFSHLNYKSNESWRFCVYIHPTKDNLLLFLQFETFDTEQGFDRVRISIQNGMEFDPSVVVLSGTKSESELKDPYYWSLGKSVSFHLCVDFTSDESTERVGFSGVIFIRENYGTISSSECSILGSSTSYADGRCGLGVSTQAIDCLGESRLESRIGCLQEAKKVPQKEFCIKSKCEFVEQDQEYDYNGIGRVDPTFRDPWRDYVNTHRKRIHVQGLMSALESTYDLILDRWAKPSFSAFFSPTDDGTPVDERYGRRILQSLLLGRRFVLSVTGGSNAAGAGVTFMSTFSMQLQGILRPLFQRIGVKGAGFRVHNGAVGNKVRTFNSHWCLPAFVYPDSDAILWYSSDDDIYHTKDRGLSETWLRHALLISHNPLISCVGKDSCNSSETGFFFSNGVVRAYEMYTSVVAFDTTSCFGNLSITNNKFCAHLSKKHLTVLGHRALAEHIAVALLRSAISFLQRHNAHLRSILSHSNGHPSAELACFLRDPKRDWSAEKATMPPPKYCQHNCVIPGWCATTLMPAVQQFFLQNYVIAHSPGVSFLSNQYTAPLIFRQGGQAPNNLKFQLILEHIGDSIEIRVKCVTKIVIVVSEGLSVRRPRMAGYLNSRANISLDGERTRCSGKANCEIMAFSGKHVLKIVANKNDVHINTIAGV